jgi:adenine-specific DNA-methyltransferase
LVAPFAYNYFHGMPTLNWIGKQAVINHHQEVPFHLLKDVPELSCGDPGSGNLIVEGDNLVALKALLPYYAKQIKCIYIDPPYNTGNEGWVYNDNVNSPIIRRWLEKVVGREGEDLSRHDKWLCMMYPRLALLHEFLRDDGVIFVSIDDNEEHSLRHLLDEVFGPRNFIGNVIWEKSDSPRMDAHFFSNRHDFIVAYARDISRASFNKIQINEEAAAHYDKQDDEGRKYYLKPLRAMGGQGDSREARPTLYYALTAPDGTQVFPKKSDGSDGAWRWRREKVDDEVSRIEWKRGRKGWSPYFRIYADTSGKRPAETIWFHSEVGSNRTSKIELKSIFPDVEPFGTPKPTKLIERIVRITTGPSDLVLDSFGGSGTTAHAVLNVNRSDGGKRRFIVVEMESSIARDVTATRINRVVAGHVNASGEAVEGLGGSFRFCQLGEPLFDESGTIRKTVRFCDLARHLFFTETGEPLPNNRVKKSPLLGITANGVAVYLLYNGVLEDRSVNGGNILTSKTLALLSRHDGPKVVYAAGSRLSNARLKREQITFKQTPYAIKVK